jgi:hypothetical protein
MLGERALTLPKNLDDEALQQSIDALDQAEHAISADRTEVIRVHDRLQEELKERYRDDPSQIPSEI